MSNNTTDKVAKVGRPKLPQPPKMSCLRRNIDEKLNGFVSDDVIWHKNVDSNRGLKTLLKHFSKKKLFEGNELNANQKWKTVFDIKLINADKELLMHNEKWINDSIVNVAQFILQKKYPLINGLQNVLLCETSDRLKPLTLKQIAAFERKDQKDFNSEISDEKKKKEMRKEEIIGLRPIEKGQKFVQILLDRNPVRNHWICVSNMKSERLDIVRIYDSDLKRIKNNVQNYSEITKNAIKRMIYYYDDIKVEIPFVCQQTDTTSGGVFAVAFAEALCRGSDPSQILFSHWPKLLRSHLLMSIELGDMKSFPVGKDRKVANAFTVRSSKQKVG